MLHLVRAERRRAGVAFAVAAALHLGAIVLVRKPVAPRVMAQSAVEPVLVWLEEPNGASPSNLGAIPSGGTASPDGRAKRALALHHPAEEGQTGTDGDPGLRGLSEEGGALVEPPMSTPKDAPSLTLDALGVGKNPFLADAARNIAKRPSPARGIRQSLTDAIMKSDQKRGLGPEAPVLTKLEQETRSSDAPGNSTALFRATTDARGHLLGFELLEASSGHREFRALGARVLSALRDLTLRIPRGMRGVTMDVRVTSHVALPSGHDPGMGIDVLGIPLKKQGGEKSPRVSILRIDPKGYKVELPGGKTLRLPSVPLPSLGEVVGDPADIGAKAQRMVRAHLENITAEASVPESRLE